MYLANHLQPAMLFLTLELTIPSNVSGKTR